MKSWIPSIALPLLACSAVAYAADFTVGPHGAFGTIQNAVNTALAIDGHHRILIERGTYHEYVEIESQQFSPPTFPGAPPEDRCFNGSIKIMGGYNENFATPNSNPDPSETIVDNLGWGHNTTISLFANDCYAAAHATTAEFSVSNLTLRNAAGKAIFAQSGQGGGIFFSNNVIDNSGSSSTDTEIIDLQVAGIESSASAPWLVFAENRIERNQTGGPPVIRLIAALNDAAASPANLIFQQNEIRDNTVALTPASLPLLTTIGVVSYPALDGYCAVTQVILWARDVFFIDNRLQNNQCWILGGSLSPETVTAADTLIFPLAGEILLERNRWLGNMSNAIIVKHAEGRWGPGSTVKIRNNVIANALASGVLAIGASDRAASVTSLSVPIINNTFYRNTTGVQVLDSRATAASGVNNIFWRHTSETSGDGEWRNNSSSMHDPRFVNEAGGDFCLRLDSPFIDAGIAADHGWIDADRTIRVASSAVNLGALECGL